MPFEMDRTAATGAFLPPFSTIPLEGANGCSWGSIELTATTATYQHCEMAPRCWLATVSTVRALDGLVRTISINIRFSSTTDDTANIPAGSLNLPQSVHALIRSCAVGDGIRVESMIKLIDSTPSSISPAILQSIDNYSGNDVLFLFPHPTLPPRQLWSNSRLLRNVSPYYETLFSSGFSETATYQVAPFPKDIVSVESSSPGTPGRSAAISKEKSEESMELVQSKREEEEQESEDDYGAIDSDDDNDRYTVSHFPTTLPIHCIVMKEPSYPTFRAFLYYLATNRIAFAPISSSFAGTPTPRDDHAIWSAVPLPVSPKSIYRLAHKLELPALQKIALTSFASQLSATNALDELFSDVSLVCDDCRKAVLAACVTNWTAIAKGVQLEDLQGKMFRGELSGVKAAVLAELFKKLKT